MKKKIAMMPTNIKEKKLLHKTTRIVRTTIGLITSGVTLMSAFSVEDPLIPLLTISGVIIHESLAGTINNSITNQAFNKIATNQYLNKTANQRLSQQVIQHLKKNGLPKEIIEENITSFLKPDLHEYFYLELLDKKNNSVFLPIYKKTKKENKIIYNHNGACTHYTKTELPNQNLNKLFFCTNTKRSNLGPSEQFLTKGQLRINCTPLIRYEAFRNIDGLMAEYLAENRY